MEPLSKATEWLLDGVATFILFYLLDLLRGYLQSGGALPFSLAFAPQSDIFSLAILAVSVALVFGRFYPSGMNSRKVGELSKELHEQFQEVWELFYPWPFYDKELGMIQPKPPVFKNRSEYLYFAKHILRISILTQAMGHGGMVDPSMRKAVEKDVRKLAVPLAKSRRRYRLSLGERLSDLLGSFP